ncbi:hypothetical protein [Sediminibacterium soli]|uniref:hypothetical protein n=1 Tax=Sediminibacterium soli TaxID=2698829 RepID=UPI00137B6284|nr:hypothetical protein [Sediminibacterium soli]NCI46571.1 hypothetical protein [Sediminibacterium soli]
MQKHWFFNPAKTYSHFATAGVWLFFAVLGGSLIGCTKDGGETPVLVDTTRNRPVAPTGMIREFYIDDTLIGYERGTFVRWYVSETNASTVVTLNGIKVAYNDALTTGPLRSNVNYVLAVNNGSQQTKTIRVADKLTTGLWNGARRWVVNDTWIWKQVRAIGSQGQDTLVYDWVSIFAADRARYLDARTSFTLTGDSKEEQLTWSYYGQLKPSGKFVATPDGQPKPFFTWKNRVYFVDTLTPLSMVVTFDTSNYSGAVTRNRIRYIPE